MYRERDPNDGRKVIVRLERGKDEMSRVRSIEDQTFSVAGNISQLQSPGFDPTAPCYDIEITSYANRVTITSG